jgi:Bacterial Ig domain
MHSTEVGVVGRFGHHTRVNRTVTPAAKLSSVRGLLPAFCVSQKLVLCLGLLSLLVSFAGVPMAAAQAATPHLARVGPTDTVMGYPTWYQDTTGLTIEFCNPLNQAELDGGWCLLLPANVPSGTAPETFPGNFGIEHFYWSGNAGDRKFPIPGTNSTAVVLLTLAVEGSFTNGFNVIPGDQNAFARIRIKINPVPFDGTYTVYTPYGKFVFADQVAGQKRGLFFTQDINLAAGAFADALNGGIGPFLLPSPTPGGGEVPPIPLLQPGQDPFYDALVAAGGAKPYPGTGKKYIADPGRIGPVTGSPLPDFLLADGTTRNANIFRIEGPNGFIFETNNFTVSGRVFEGPIAGEIKPTRASYARDAAGNSTVTAYATATPNSQGRLPAGLPPATTATVLEYYDAPCTATLDANGNPGPPYSAPSPLPIPNQMFASASNYFGESNPFPLPAELCLEGNAVNAAGQTVLSFQPMKLGDQVFITEALFDPASHALSVRATSSDLFVPQTLNVSGLGDVNPVTGQLLVSPLFAPPETVAVLSTGSGLNHMQVSTGAVAGGNGGVGAVPLAINDTASVLENCSATATTIPCATPLNINVLANDASAIGGTVTLTSSPVLGTATVNADGSISYTPKLFAFGSDSFTYTVTVGTQVSNAASVTVTITHVNQLPVAINDTTGALRGIANSVNVLANDTDPDGATDLASAVIVTGNASLGITAGTIFANGIVSFTPPSTTAAGPYTFTYNAVDQSGAPSAAPATVTVNLSTAEAIVVAKSIYTQAKGRWTVSGTDSPAAGQTMSITYVDGTYKVAGACTGSSAGVGIGKATVDSLGNWLYDQILTSTTGVLNPSNTLGNSTGFWCTPPKTLRITSSLGTSVTAAISLK